MMRNALFCVFLCLFCVRANSVSTKLTSSQEKEAIVRCANYHLYYCELLINQGVQSVKSCNARTECEFIGWLYLQTQEYELSIPYLYKACMANNFESCNNLGISYQRLNNYKKTKKFYKFGCDNGYIISCYNLATLYYEGLGVRRNYKYANELYKKVCNFNQGIGCLHLAISYANGHGVTKDIDNARSLFNMACILGNNEGCNFYDEYKEEELQ